MKRLIVFIMFVLPLSMNSCSDAKAPRPGPDSVGVKAHKTSSDVIIDGKNKHLKGCEMKKFTLERDKAALVIIDMQTFSCVTEDKTRKLALDRVVMCINQLADTCRRLNVPVIWVRHNLHSKGNVNDGGFFQLFHDEKRTRAVMNYGPGTEIFSEMDVDTGRDYVVFKNRYSAFLAKPPELQNKLQELGRKQLLITGIAANVCVESTLRDAMQLDYEVILVSDGTIGTDETSYQNTIKNTRLFFGDVQSTAEIICDISKN